jgi:hypothetical protein
METLGLEAWKTGKKISRLHLRRGKMSSTSDAFMETFPDMFSKSKGDKNKEQFLFFCIQTFSYGYMFPGFHWDYVKTQCHRSLRAPSEDSSRVIFY